ncbi:response regulator [Chitinibacter bivalviorum]|uniref:Response regulator n=1 Tax=Chitinibacter bivalviorum TaxID=2739434 RepID=A0A7H9BLZ8_9NEIS|nr:response regulator [Chitinibacter bivalviorum]QLG89710.1 response regulator [Chitinibacter bivalviorum]
MTDSTELGARPKILVVDDSRIVRATIKKHLSELYELVEEADGEAGWRRLMSDDSISLLLSDLTMPELDGLGLLARVRASGEARMHYLPVIIISGEEDEETKLRCVECGANDFVTKSTDRTEMLARVKANLDLAQTRRDLAESRSVQIQTSTTDAMTGVGSSHLLNLQLEQSLAFAFRHNSEVTVMLLEINHGQTLQNKLGERVHGQLLGLLAKLLEAKLRKEDTLARLNDSMFAIVSPATPLIEARVVAERLRQTVANARVNYRNEQLRVTASIAVANSWHDDVHSAERMMALVQDRLFADPMDNHVFMVDAATTQTPIPLISEALVMLHKGSADELRPHLKALLNNLKPLLQLANEDLALNWDLSKLD